MTVAVIKIKILMNFENISKIKASLNALIECGSYIKIQIQTNRKAAQVVHKILAGTPSFL
jgi:hypothetical protein